MIEPHHKTSDRPSWRAVILFICSLAFATTATVLLATV